MDKQQFTCQLAEWHALENKRELPWKEEKDAYKIWLSEIILQQTRAAMGVKYYEAFINAYPTINDLANAPDEEVFKLWEGLGYYNRCRNLLITARRISFQLGGKFPDTYESILSLQGVGPYTAAAIASFAYHLPHAVVDGNVFRVLARYFKNFMPIDSAEGKKLFTALATELLDANHPAAHNQAIMDFGAVVCKPVAPLCSQCPLQSSCGAYRDGVMNELPVKAKQLLKKERWFTYFVFVCNGKTLTHQRAAKDIWLQLHEFYLLETSKEKFWSEDDVRSALNNEFGTTDSTILYVSPQLTQQLTHQTVNAIFIKVKLAEIPAALQQYNWVTDAELQKLAFPKIINEYLQSTSFPARLF